MVESLASGEKVVALIMLPEKVALHLERTTTKTLLYTEWKLNFKAAVLAQVYNSST